MTRASSTAARRRSPTAGVSWFTGRTGCADRPFRTGACAKKSCAQVEALRDQVSGVSLDEEAMQLMKFQRAYEANARFFRVIDQTLDILFSTVGR